MSNPEKKNAASILHPLFHHDDMLAQWMMQSSSSSSSFQLSSGLSFSFLPLPFPIVQMSKSLWSPFSSQEQTNPTTTTTLSNMENKHQRRRRLRIGIVGGGIMGITVANSLLLKKKNNNNNNNMTNDVDIIVYEGDENGPGSGMMDEFHANRSSPSYWRAATARNANTIAVGAAMHVFATRSVIWGVLTDVTQKAIRNLKKHLSTNVTPSLEGPMDSVLPAGATTIDDFNVEPPYFGVHLNSCMGWNVPSDERMAFGRFLSTFLYTALFHGGQDASKHRGQTLMQLAKASRHVFLSKKDDGMQQYSCTSNSYTEGILAIHRTPESAQHTLQECNEFQEDARAVSWEEALEYEPRLANIPTTNPLYAVLRLHDIAASCEEYMRRLLVDTRRRGVSYETKKVTNIDYTNRGGYTLTFDTGESTEVDILVLAAGAETPLLAHQLGVGRYVPIYPLRGYSYTVINDRDSTSWWSGHSKNMLQTAFTMDRMYMSSVKPWMARVTGFAELAGFRNSAQDSPSVEAPLILTRYAKALFGSKDTTTTTTTKEEKNNNNNMETDMALQCFRPMSPDDLPVVGAIPTRPGLFVHTGHGTLGWTMAFATAECVSQDIQHYISSSSSSRRINKKGIIITTPVENNSEPYILPDGTTMDRNVLSPSRFAWFSS